MANQMNISAAAAEYTCGRSLVEGTKGNYRGKLNTMKVFFLSRGYEDCLDTSKEGINIPIRNEIVEELFGWISVNTDLPKKRKRFEPDAGEEEDFGYDEDPEMVDIVAEQFHDEPDHKKRKPDNSNNKRKRVDAVDVDGFGDDEDLEMGEEAAKPGKKKRKVNKSPDPSSRELDVFAERQITVSVSCMQGYKSALKWLYTLRKVVFPDCLDQWLDNFVKGYKKIVAEKKLNGIMELNEGRYSLSFAGYCFLSEVFMKLHPMGNKYPYKESIFGWCFEVLCWNIIGRCSNIQKLMLPTFQLGGRCNGCEGTKAER